MAALSNVGSGPGSTAPLQGFQEPGSMAINASTKPVVVLALEDDERIKDSLRIAFAILKHIKGLRLPSLKGGQMDCIRPDLFEEGPAWRNAAWESATKTGFILDMSGGSPALITLVGQWHTGIVSHRSGSEVKETIDSLQGPLDLKLIQNVETVEGWGDHGPYYSINQWDGQSLPNPFYREKDELVPLERIRVIWKDLAPEFFPKTTAKI
jgi:hypothetical protein